MEYVIKKELLKSPQKRFRRTVQIIGNLPSPIKIELSGIHKIFRPIIRITNTVLLEPIYMTNIKLSFNRENGDGWGILIRYGLILT